MKCLTLIAAALFCSATFAGGVATSGGAPAASNPRMLVQVDCQTGEPVLDAAGRKIEVPADESRTVAATGQPEFADKPKECERRSPSNNGCSGGECKTGNCKETGLSMNSCKCFK